MSPQSPPLPPRLVLVANARMPSQRAQSVQVANAAVGFERAGVQVTVVHARRRDTREAPAEDVFRALLAGGLPEGTAPGLVAAPCVDWIDRVPRSGQFLPARLQEWSFGRSAARIVTRRFPSARVIARDVEVAHALRSQGARVAWEIHRLPGGRLRRGMARRALDAGVLPLAISGGVAEDVQSVLGVSRDRIHVAHDAIDPSFVEAMPSRAEARLRLGLDADKPVVLYAGGLLRWKGVETLVEAGRGDGLGGAQVVIVGGMDQDVRDLEETVGFEPNVRVDGFKPAREIPTYLAAADLAVVPNRRAPRISSHYTSPLKVFESLAAGLPLVVSDLPSMRDVLDEKTAVFVEPESPEDLARGVRELLDDSGRRARMAEAGRERVRSNTWEARARKILSIFDSAGAATP